MSSEDRLLQLLSRKMAGEASIQELDELEQLAKQNPIWNSLINKLALDAADETAIDADNADAAFAAHALKMQLAGKIDQLPKDEPPIIQVDFNNKRNYKWLLKIAAILVVSAGGIYTWIALSGKPNKAFATNEVVTKKAASSKIKLPDGTQVWLNADSKLSYDENFSGKLREVKLTGEAYFDVCHDSLRPFIIHTDKINIKVLGTAFNVKSYPQDETEETTLIRGKIEVTFNGRPTEKIILKPAEKLIVRNNQAELVNTNSSVPKMQLTNLTMVKDSVVAETAWMSNTLTFTNQDFQNIAHMLERRFDVNLIFNDEEVKQFIYTGTYDSETLEQILSYLQISKPFHFNIKNKVVTIYK